MARKKKFKDRPIRVRPQIVLATDEANRKEWDYDTYVVAGQDAAKVKGYTEWIIGKLTSEVVAKKYGDIVRYARDIRIPANSVYVYKHIYERLTEAEPDFFPDGFVPYGVLQMAAKAKTIEQRKEILKELYAQSVTTMEHGHRVVKEKETGKKVPGKPVFKIKWNDETGTWQALASDKDIDRIDWSVIEKQLLKKLKP